MLKQERLRARFTELKLENERDELGMRELGQVVSVDEREEKER